MNGSPESVVQRASAETPTGEVLVYETPDGGVHVDVRLERETVWLSLTQMAELFERDKSVISRHLRNVFASGELERGATVAKNATVQREASREVTREIEFFNLDAILSVGYRVNSRRGTQFRIWATRTLREHLVRGYTINRQRFEDNARELEAALALVRKAAAGEALTSDQGRGLVDIIARYTQTFLLLQRYDAGMLIEPRGIPGGALPQVEEARAAIRELKQDLVARGEATELFGGANAKRDSRPCSATSIRAYSASLRIRRSSPKPRTSSTSSSRTIPSPMATSASAPSCSSSSCIATEDSCEPASR